MSNFEALGQLVTEARNLLDSIKGGAIRVMQATFDAFLATSNTTFEGKLADYQQQVNEVTQPPVELFLSLFERKTVSYDPINGNDSSKNGPFRTLKAAIYSVPDGGTITIHLPYGEVETVHEINEGHINVGSRNVSFVGGYHGMEEENKKLAFMKFAARKDERLNRSYLSTWFTGSRSARIDFNCCGLEIPRRIFGTQIEHSHPGTLIAGNVSFSMNTWNTTGPHIRVEDNGTNEPPMRIFLSDARDNKKSMDEITLSHVDIETAEKAPLIDLRSNGTMRFSVYSASLSDKSGEPIEWGQLFAGLTYGTHGYATNLLAVEAITREVV